MSIPNVAGALNGWMQRKTIQIVTKSIANHQVIETTASSNVHILIQPLPQEKVERKIESQRSWKWWSIWMKKAPALKIDDKIIVEGISYRIESIKDWNEAGYQFYEAAEGYG